MSSSEARAIQTIFSPAQFWPLHRPIVNARRGFVGADQEYAMGKERHNSKEAKKQALKTPKEKKAAKQAKKHASDIVPIITR